MAKRLAMLFGATFAVVGILGFIPNPLVGPDGFFATNSMHNFFHLFAGIILMLCAMRTERASALGLDVFGAIYLLLAVLGFAVIGNEGHTVMAGMHVNGNDNWLHVVLGVVLLAAGLSTRRSPRVIAQH
jgi:hypothetical protein